MSVSSADGEGIHLDDGRAVTDLKVVELRKELEMRNLPKSGNKKELTERLKKYLMSNGEGAITSSSHGGTPKSSANSSPVKSPEPMENPLVARYRATQEERLRQARQEAEMHRTSSGGEEAEVKTNDRQRTESENTTSSKKSADNEAPDAAPMEAEEAVIEQQKQPDQTDELATAQPVSEKGDVAPEAVAEKAKIEQSTQESIVQPNESTVSEEAPSAEPEESPMLAEERTKSPSPTENIEEEAKEEASGRKQSEESQSPSRTSSAADSSNSTPAATSPKAKRPLTEDNEKQEAKDTKPAELEVTTEKQPPMKADEDIDKETADQEDTGAPEGVVVGAQDELDYEEEEGENEESKKGETGAEKPPATKRAPQVYTEGVVVVSEAAAAAAKSTEETPGEPAENLTAQGLVRRRPVSPPRNPASKLIHIRQLKRPFTLTLLKTLLKNFGTLVEEDFWIDSIKSNCIAKFESEEQAEQAREGLHNVVWPPSSDQSLIVEFSTDEKLARRREEGDKSNDFGLKIIVDNSKTKDEPSLRDSRMDSRESNGGRRGAPNDESQQSPSRKRKAADNEPTRTLEDIFMKTKTLPAIYYLPLTEEEADKRQLEKKKTESSKPAASSRNGVDRDRSPYRRRISPVRGGRRSPDPKRGRRDDSPPRGYRSRH